MSDRRHYLRKRRALHDQNAPSEYEVLNNDVRFFRVQSTVFFIFFIALFLLVIGTTDAMLFLESPIQLPFVGVQLTLKGFYIFAPLLLLAWHSLILFHARQHYRRLYDRWWLSRGHNKVLDDLTLGWFEQMIKTSGKARWAWGSLNVCLYCLLPLLALSAFYYRFAAYQDGWISSVHLVLIVLDLVLISRLWVSRKAIKTGVSWIIPVLFFVSSLGLLYWPIIFLISYPGTPIKVLKSLKSLRIGDIPIGEWLIPHLQVRGEILVQLSASDYAVIRTLHLKDEQALSGAVENSEKLPLIDRTGRSFRFADLVGSTIPRTRFSNARLEFSQLKGANMIASELIATHLEGADLSGAHLRKVQFEGTNLGGIQLEGADLREAHLEGANLVVCSA